MCVLVFVCICYACVCISFARGASAGTSFWAFAETFIAICHVRFFSPPFCIFSLFCYLLLFIVASFHICSLLALLMRYVFLIVLARGGRRRGERPLPEAPSGPSRSGRLSHLY